MRHQALRLHFDHGDNSMRPGAIARPGERLRVLALGAHADDIEIGAGGTLMTWIASGIHVDARWCVLSAVRERAAEANASAASFLKGASAARISVKEFRDGYFPHDGAAIKEWLEGVRHEEDPDVILTHRRDDAHQDHREISHLTSTVFRDHLILEYEIPKWDGDLGQPNVYMPLSSAILDRKLELLRKHFSSQRTKDWFDPDVFRGLSRLRGMECRASERFAEAFTVRKMRIG